MKCCGKNNNFFSFFLKTTREILKKQLETTTWAYI
jgi:hypothetical protein